MVVQVGERWSVGEVVEHIVLGDGVLFETATKSLTGQPDGQWHATLSKTETLRRAVPVRSRRVDAPGVSQPRRWIPREELLSRFIGQRARVLKYARETDAPLKAHTAGEHVAKRSTTSTGGNHLKDTSVDIAAWQIYDEGS